MKRARSSAPSASVRYRLFLVKLFSFIRFIDVRNTLSMQILNRYGANVFPCKTPTTMSKK